MLALGKSVANSITEWPMDTLTTSTKSQVLEGGEEGRRKGEGGREAVREGRRERGEEGRRKTKGD